MAKSPKQSKQDKADEPEVFLDFSKVHVLDREGKNIVQNNSYVCYNGAGRNKVYYMINQNKYFKEAGEGQEYTDIEIMDMGFPAPSDIAMARQTMMEEAVRKGKVPNWAEICMATLPKNIGPSKEIQDLLEARKETAAQKFVRSLVY